MWVEHRWKVPEIYRADKNYLANNHAASQHKFQEQVSQPNKYASEKLINSFIAQSYLNEIAQDRKKN